MGSHRRSRSCSGRRSSHGRWPPSSRLVSRSPSPSRSPPAHHSPRERRSDQIRSLRENQRRQGEDIAAMREMIWEMSVVWARAEKRPAEIVHEPDSGVEARFPYPPPPLPPLVVPVTVGGGVAQPTVFQPFSGESRWDRPPMQFVMGETSDFAQTGGQKMKTREVDHFLKNGG